MTPIPNYLKKKSRKQSYYPKKQPQNRKGNYPSNENDIIGERNSREHNET